MKNKFLKAALVGLFLTVSSLASAALIIQNQNVSTNSFSHTFSAFDSSLGNLESVTFSFDVSLVGTIFDDDCSSFSDCDGTRTLDLTFNGLSKQSAVFIDNNEFNFALSLNIADIVSFDTGDFANWTALGNVLVSSSCSGDCYNEIGNSTQTGTVSLSYEYSEVPEPSTLAIFALGLMGLASRRFKKKS
jgi:hypothetical protein